jgi:4-hydroxybenzoate polyprenyltransferase
MVKERISSTKAFFTAIRLKNALALSLGVLLLRYSYFEQLPSPADLPLELLFILSVFFVSSGGAIINDYFDSKEDRIKRPDRANIGRSLKRRVALITHIICSILGLTTSVAVAEITDNNLSIFIALTAIITLFLYSTAFKSRLLIGHLALSAVLTSFIPFSLADVPLENLGNQYDWLCTFTFLATFTRQLVKDIEDYQTLKEIPGALELHKKTLLSVISLKAYWSVIYVLIAFIAMLLSVPFQNSSSNIFLAVLAMCTSAVAYFAVKQNPQPLAKWIKLLLAAGLAWLLI